jgi:hypothetical protein
MVLGQVFTGGSVCPYASGGRRIRSFRSATSVATTAVLAEEMSARNRAAIPLDFRNPRTDENFALKSVCRFYISSYARSPLRGLFRRPAALGLLLRIARPFGVLVPPKTSLQSAAKNALQTFLGFPPRKQTFGTWEPGPLASFAQRDPSNNGRIQKTETLSCIKTK